MRNIIAELNPLEAAGLLLGVISALALTAQFLGRKTYKNSLLEAYCKKPQSRDESQNKEAPWIKDQENLLVEIKAQVILRQAEKLDRDFKCLDLFRLHRILSRGRWTANTHRQTSPYTFQK